MSSRKNNKKGSKKGGAGRGRTNKKRGDGSVVQQWLSTAFLLYMFAVYPLIMHDKYFDITITKYKAFAVGLCIYAVLMVLAVLADVFDESDRENHEDRIDTGRGLRAFMARYGIAWSDIFMTGFLVANVIAFLISSDKASAYTGDEGRRCGLQFVLLTYFLYVCLGRRYKLRGYELGVFMLVGSFTGIIAILQYIGCDFLGLREGLSDSIRSIYISTFGNIDVYASFLCVLVPIAMGVLLCDMSDARHLWNRVIAGITVCIGTAAVVITNADLAYAGIGAAVLMLIPAAFYMGRVRELIDVFTFAAMGLAGISIALRRSAAGYGGLDGFGRIAERTSMLTCVFIALLLVDIVVRRMAETRLRQIKGRPALCVAAVICVLCVLAAFMYAGSSSDTMLSFCDSWGNYRGYVWRRLASIYGDFPVHKWLFGNGNESVRRLMTDNYYDEMIDTVGVIYDNAHNEYLQYLVTTGIFGAVTYIGLLVTSVSAIIRRQAEICRNAPAEGRYAGMDTSQGACMALVLGVTGYAVQAIFNINQSLTTPYMFLMLALAAGVCREEKALKE